MEVFDDEDDEDDPEVGAEVDGLGVFVRGE